MTAGDLELTRPFGDPWPAESARIQRLGQILTIKRDDRHPGSLGLTDQAEIRLMAPGDA